MYCTFCMDCPCFYNLRLVLAILLHFLCETWTRHWGPCPPGGTSRKIGWGCAVRSLSPKQPYLISRLECTNHTLFQTKMVKTDTLFQTKTAKKANTVSFPLMSQLEACSGSSFDSLICKCQSSINQALSRQSDSRSLIV